MLIDPELRLRVITSLRALICQAECEGNFSEELILAKELLTELEGLFPIPGEVDNVD